MVALSVENTGFALDFQSVTIYTVFISRAPFPIGAMDDFYVIRMGGRL